MLLGYFSVAIGVGADDSATVLGRAVNYTVSPKTYHSCLGHISGKCRPIFKKNSYTVRLHAVHFCNKILITDCEYFTPFAKLTCSLFLNGNFEAYSEKSQFHFG